MTSDEDVKQNEIIKELEDKIEELNKMQIEYSEVRRGWVRTGIVFWFIGLISYVVIRHTGISDGMIKPDVVWSFGTGVLVTKIMDHYYNVLTKKDRVL